jgi:hypothetical protein
MMAASVCVDGEMVTKMLKIGGGMSLRRYGRDGFKCAHDVGNYGC